jgi:hypothetical protein
VYSTYKSSTYRYDKWLNLGGYMPANVHPALVVAAVVAVVAVVVDRRPPYSSSIGFGCPHGVNHFTVVNAWLVSTSSLFSFLGGRVSTANAIRLVKTGQEKDESA